VDSIGSSAQYCFVETGIRPIQFEGASVTNASKYMKNSLNADLLAFDYLARDAAFRSSAKLPSLGGVGGILMKTWFILTVCLWSFQASAQGTYTATSCSLSAISAAIAAEQAQPVDGDIISIPSGTCTWTGTAGLNATFTHSVTIQGAGAVSATTGGTSLTGTDNTIIIDNLGNGRPGITIQINTIAGKSFRWTGIALEGNSSSTQASNGILAIEGTSTAVRVDHSHFHIPAQTSQGLALTDGPIQGVADHDYFDSPSTDLTNNVGFRNGFGWNGASTSDNGNNSWATADNFGTSQFFFVEDSQFLNGDVSDADYGSRYVFRHNTVLGTNGACPQMYNHGVATGIYRGMRASEVYVNTFSCPGANTGKVADSPNTGVALFWGNNISGGYSHAITISYNFRNQAGGGGNYHYPPPPAGWGFCGSTAGGPTNWDGNHNAASGYPCLGQPGRGKGDLLTGSSFATLVNSTTGTVSWPHEALDPVYSWMNTSAMSFGGNPLFGNTTAGSSTPLATNNQEYYWECGSVAGGATNSSCPSGFTGAAGTGFGALAARPSTCAAGNDPVTGTEAPGVAYWGTDTNTLYVCTAANTWTVDYTPFSYPHPLTAAVSGDSVNAPTNVTVTVN
jgi:hypothetical protein